LIQEQSRWHELRVKLDALEVEQSQWKADKTELENLRAEKSQWSIQDTELNELRAEKVQWSGKDTELNNLRENQRKYWNVDRVELEALRMEQQNWQDDETSRSTFREEVVTLRGNRTQWERDAAELEQLRRDEQQWYHDRMELDRLTPLEGELNQLRLLESQWFREQSELNQLRMDQQQWALDRIELDRIASLRRENETHKQELSNLAEREREVRYDAEDFMTKTITLVGERELLRKALAKSCLRSWKQSVAQRDMNRRVDVLIEEHKISVDRLTELAHVPALIDDYTRRQEVDAETIDQLQSTLHELLKQLGQFPDEDT
jgi:hypothetical protein